jgi:hypothetical protein
MKGIYLTLILLGCLWMTACRKTDYPLVNSPAYVRVFNCLTYNVTIDNKDAPAPYLTMLIDPKLDAKGIPVGAAITFDFLKTRGPLAMPYPDAGNTSLWQTEFPGTAKVAVGPIVNGFDLSSYGEIASGTHRFMFVTRPFSSDPFYTLNDDTRKNVIVDTTITLTNGEIYTMNVVQRSVYTQKAGIYLRNEQFTKIPFSDSSVYVNFYNISAEGFSSTYLYSSNAYNRNLHDSMSVYLALYNSNRQIVSGYNNMFLCNMIRSQQTDVHPYYSFPLFPDTINSHGNIYAGQQSQAFTFFAVGRPIDYNFFGTNSESYGLYSIATVGPVAPVPIYNLQGDINTGLAVTTRSGIYNPRTFATVNTIEYINGNMYLTTLQRRYDPPIY